MDLGLVASGIKAALRQRKRFTVFSILFIFLCGTMTTQGLELDSYNTNRLLQARGAVYESSQDTDGSHYTIPATLRAAARGIYYVWYGDLPGVELGVLSVQSYKSYEGPVPWGRSNKEIPWILSEIKPTTLTKGNFPSEDGKALINSDYTISTGGGEVQLSVAAVGSEISINIGGSSLDFEIAGIYPAGAGETITGGGGAENLLYVNWGDWEKLSGNLGNKDIIRIVMTASGMLINGAAMNNRDQIRAASETIGPSGDLTLMTTEKLEHSTYRRLILQTFATFIGSLFIVAIYAFLIVRFRKNEIATLRAIGWSGGNIKTYVLAELFSLVFLSYVISLIFSLLATYFWIQVPLTSFMTLLGSLGVVLLTIGFGWLIISKGVLRVSPMEAFRGR